MTRKIYSADVLENYILMFIEDGISFPTLVEKYELSMHNTLFYQYVNKYLEYSLVALQSRKYNNSYSEKPKLKVIGQPRMNKFIKITLQLEDENIIFDTKNEVEEKKFKNRSSLFFYAKLEMNPQYCPACCCEKEGHNIVINCDKKSRITLTKVSGHPAYLVLRKQRYY